MIVVRQLVGNLFYIIDANLLFVDERRARIINGLRQFFVSWLEIEGNVRPLYHHVFFEYHVPPYHDDLSLQGGRILKNKHNSFVIWIEINLVSRGERSRDIDRILNGYSVNLVVHSKHNLLGHCVYYCSRILINKNLHKGIF